MSRAHKQRYFVRQLDEFDYKPLPNAAFEVQILNANGEGEHCAFIDRDSNRVVAFVHLTTTGPVALDVDKHGIPDAVIEAARTRRVGFGEDVDESGAVIQPSFLPPWTRG